MLRPTSDPDTSFPRILDMEVISTPFNPQASINPKYSRFVVQFSAIP